MSDEKIIQRECIYWFGKTDENGGFLLKHSVVFKPAGIDLDVPMIYTDYYYLEAINRLLRIHSM